MNGGGPGEPPRDLLPVRLLDPDSDQPAPPLRPRGWGVVVPAVVAVTTATLLVRGVGLPERPPVDRPAVVDSYAERAALGRDPTHLVARVRNPGPAVRLDAPLVHGTGLVVDEVDGPDELGAGGTADLVVALRPDCASLAARRPALHLELTYDGARQRRQRLVADLVVPEEWALADRCAPRPPPPARLDVELGRDDQQEGRALVRVVLEATEAVRWTGLTTPGGLLRADGLPREVPAGASASVLVEVSLVRCEPVQDGFGDVTAVLDEAGPEVAVEPGGRYADAVTRLVRECVNG